ncbi:MAG: hypothetical protein Q9217_006161 [Psora testacea]
MASLEEKLCGAPGTMAACRRELDNSRMALAAANEKHVACYNTLIREQQRLMECSQAYKNLYEQNGQMVNEMHGLATTNVSLRQELERAYKTIESSHAQNVEFEALLDSMVMADSVAEGSRSDTAEGLEARIMALKKRLKMEEERREVLLKDSNHTVAAEENMQELGGKDGIASPAMIEQSDPLNESDNGGARKKHKTLKGSRRQESRKPKHLTIVRP